MRNLTIYRQKSFVASAAKMRVYIEDPTFGDVEINGVPCTLIGVLRNGQESTFSIGTEAARVYVVADKLSRGYCNDYYPLPEGEEDIYLTGKNHFNPFAGNSFQFDGVTDELVLENRKKNKNKGIVVLIAALIVGLALGFFVTRLAMKDAAPAKDFSAGGLTITLTEDFTQIPADGFALYCESPDVAMFALKEDFFLMPGAEDYTVEEYADLVFQNNPMAATAQLYTEGTLTWFEYSYTNTTEALDYRFFVFIFKSDDAFWMLQFATPEALAEEKADGIIEWAKSVSFS